MGIPLNDEEVDMLLNELDKDGDGEINYRYTYLITKTNLHKLCRFYAKIVFTLICIYADLCKLK